MGRLPLLCVVLPLVIIQATAERSSCIVHMDDAERPSVFLSKEDWYSSTLTSLHSSNSPLSAPQPIYSYHHVTSGFAALLSPQELDMLSKSRGFLSSYPDKAVKLDTTHIPEFLKLNPVLGLWPVSNFGEDVIVGVIDTGVWPESPSFSDVGMPNVPDRWKGSCQEGEDFNSSLCNKKLIGARYFNRGYMAQNQFQKPRMSSARDTYGHGTHTSSTAAGRHVEGASFFGYAKGTAKGVASRARVAIYKVSWEDDMYASDFLAGMDAAVADGVDVISISLCLDGVSLYEDPIAIAAFAAMEKGIFISASAGNDGPLGSLHNGIPWLTTVAAGTVDRSFAGRLTLGNGFTIYGWTLFPASAVICGWPLVYNQTLSPCDSSELLSTVRSDSIIVCDIGDVFGQLGALSEARVTAVVVSDDPTIFEFSGVIWPAMVISTDDRSSLLHYATTSSSPTATMTFQETSVGMKERGPAVAYYTSRGPSPSCPTILKLDLMAPGSMVLASWNPYLEVARIGETLALSSEFNIMSGTSMACPHASGVAALLKGAHPDWSVAAIRSAMMTTANPQDSRTHKPIRDNGLNFEAASPLAMGAGQIDPNQALDPGLIYDTTPQEYVNFVCSLNFTSKQISTITRSSLYNCSHPTPDLNYPSFIALYNKESPATTIVRKFRRTLTNVGDAGANYKATVTAPSGSIVEVSTSTLTFESQSAKRNYTLTLRYSGHRDGRVSFGSITWVEEGGKHHVRSLIVISPTV